MATTIADIRSDLKLMEASGTDVFFRFTLTTGKSGKTDIMTPAAAESFLDTVEMLGEEFAFIWLGRGEQF